MNRDLVDKIVNAVLYEGYILYPYRASSKKNQRERFTFGRVYPKEYSELQGGREPYSMQTECLLRNESHDAWLDVSVKFLQPLVRESDNQVWLEALEREVTLSPVPLNAPVNQSYEFTFAAAQPTTGGVRRRNETISGRVELTTQLLDEA